MSLLLYRPFVWAGGEGVCAYGCAREAMPWDVAMWLRLRRATYLRPCGDEFFFHPTFGETMSDDVSSALTLVTPPASEPVTLAQAKAFLRIEHTADDAAITTAITAARQVAEHYLRMALLPQSWSYTRANPCEMRMRLPLGPATSITSITLTNELGTSSTMNTANYRLSVDGFLVLFTATPQTEKLTVAYAAGAYALASVVPAPILQGMLHHIAVMMETRDGVAALPVQAMQCYGPFRRVAL